MLLPDVFLNLVRVSHTMFHVLLVAPVVPDYEGCPTSTYQQFTRGTSVGLWASMEKRLTKNLRYGARIYPLRRVGHFQKESVKEQHCEQETKATKLHSAFENLQYSIIL